MANKVIFTVEGKGKNLKKTSKEVNDLGRGAERAGKGLDGASKSQDKYHRGAKGTAGATSNSTKAFSKMQQSIGGGSSGLVGAYATLAANLFAASAAFNALQKAAQLEGVVKALDDVGAAAGRNLTAASARLREVSGQAISADQSLRAMSLGISSGFSTDQMEGLTKVARGASVALGRDLGDALDRLTRGTAKLEPEILDELGIMVRLDDATAEYAATIGKSVNDLSQYERRQAFLNATLEQGQKKFGELAETIEVNPYDKLAAALGDTAKQFLTLINNGVKPFVEILAENQGVLVGTIVMFASTIAKQLLPAMTTLGAKTVQQSKLDAKASADRLKLLNVSNGMPKAYIQAAQAMSKGTITQQQYDKALRSTALSISRHEAGLQKMTLSNLEATKSYVRKAMVMRQVKKAREDLIRTAMMHATVQAKENAGNAIQMIGQGSLIKGFMSLGRSISLFTTQTLGATAAGNGMTRTMGFMRIGAFALSGALRGVGSAFMAMLGPIGLVVSVGMMLYDTFKDRFIQATPVKDEADKIIGELDNIEKVGVKFAENMDKNGAGSAENVVAGYKALGGVLGELKGNLNRVQRAHEKTKQAAVNAAQDEIAANQEKLVKQQEIVDSASGHRKTTAAREIEGIKKNIAEQQTLMEAAEAEMKTLAPTELLRVLDETQSRLTDSGAFGEFSAQGIAAMKTVREQMAGTDATMEEINASIEEAIRPMMNIAGAFDGARDAASQFRKEQTKLATKATTPFDGVIDASEGMLKQLQQVDAAIADMAKSGGTDTSLNEQRKTLMAEVQKQMGSENLTGTGDLKEYVDNLIKARDELLKHNKAMKGLQIEQKLLNKLDKQGRSVGTIKALIANEKAMFTQRIEGAQATIDLNKLALGVDQTNRLATEKALLAEMDLRGETGSERQNLLNSIEEMESRIDNARLSSIKAQAEQEQALYEQKIANATETFRLTVRENEELIKTAKHEKEINDLTKERTSQLGALIKARTEATLLATAGATGDESASKGQELVAAEATKKLRADALVEEHRLRNLMISLEFNLLDAKTQLFEAELAVKLEEKKIGQVAYDNAIAASDKALESARTISKLQKANSDRQLLVDQTVMANSDKRLQLQAQTEARNVGQDAGSAIEAIEAIEAYRKGLENASIAAKSAIKDDIIAQFANETGAVALGEGVYQFTKDHFETLQQKIKEAVSPEASAAMGATGPEAVSLGVTTGITADKPEESTGLDLMKDRLASTQAVLGPMISDLKGMGPEGEVVAAVTGGVLAMGEAFTTMKDNVKEGANATSESLKMASAAVSMVGNIMAANSRSKVAGIDSEIAAEKKRDGQSKESLAKIAALEKKKEKEKRKAFEMNKKMQMATIIIDTAAAAMKVMGQTGIFGIGMVPMVVAMGAAQLAMVASQSYQGGGGSMSGGGSSAPSKVSMGGRQNNVDVATGPSRASGELSYMRGARGQGNSASSFTPAFGGVKYRAAGGAAYMIGEQGPEVFVPEVPGRIVPNDEVRQGGGSPINANFTIQAIDSTNMEQTLTAQRGNIIGMIREAANNSGESFLESVDTMALGAEQETY